MNGIISAPFDFRIKSKTGQQPTRPVFSVRDIEVPHIHKKFEDLDPTKTLAYGSFTIGRPEESRRIISQVPFTINPCSNPPFHLAGYRFEGVALI